MAEETGVKESNAAAAEQSPKGQFQPQGEESGQTIPKERMDQLIAENNQLKKGNEELLGQVGLYRARLQNPGPAAGAPAAENQQGLTREKLLSGLEDDDVVTGSEVKGKLGDIYDAVSTEVGRLQFLVVHPDYAELVGTTDAPGKWIKDAAIKNPSILTEIEQSNNPMLTAYNHARAAKDAASGTKTPAAKEPAGDEVPLSAEAQAVLDAANRPRSPAAAGSSSGGLSRAQHYASMSRDDVLSLARDLAEKA